MGKNEKEEKNQSKKVNLIVSREFSGERTMQEAFEQVIEEKILKHFEEWLERRSLMKKTA